MRESEGVELNDAKIRLFPTSKDVAFVSFPLLFFFPWPYFVSLLLSKLLLNW